MSQIRRTAILNTVGLIVLLIGIGSAGLIYRSGQKPPALENTTGEWKDGSLSLTESKTATRNIELFGGKLEVLMVQWQERLQRPTAIAIITSAISTLIALGCFLAAHLLTEKPLFTKPLAKTKVVWSRQVRRKSL